MGLRKRANRTTRPTSGAETPRGAPRARRDTTSETTHPDVTTPAALTHRGEKILLMLAVQSQQLDDRLTRLEDRVETVLRDSAAQPDQQDLLELRLNSARLAAEVSRLAIELRSEIKALGSQGEIIDLTLLDDGESGDDDLRDDADPDGAEAISAHPSAAIAPHRRVDDVVRELRDYDPRDHEPKTRPRPTSGWKPIRTSKPPDSTA